MINLLDSSKQILRTFPNEIDGWYPSQTTSTIRELIKSRMEILMKSKSNSFADGLFDSGLIANDPLIGENISDDEEYDLWDL